MSEYLNQNVSKSVSLMFFSYANKYLIAGSDPLLDTYERFKHVITFIFSGLYIPAQQLKPFNPYVRETF